MIPTFNNHAYSKSVEINDLYMYAVGNRDNPKNVDINTRNRLDSDKFSQCLRVNGDGVKILGVSYTIDGIDLV